jgi:hypothetical protein
VGDRPTGDSGHLKGEARGELKEIGGLTGLDGFDMLCNYQSGSEGVCRRLMDGSRMAMADD